ncbi:hypothetical protein AWB65_05448 [Caballeronia humi]|uniref:Uncharacterized protein n=1 Tax=Caballeronia humi TaxID=326474 RepID=A0A158IVZ9_9BURK|nr:hypothetical protein AWB65_05448 [Caballeronia humi]
MRPCLAALQTTSVRAIGAGQNRAKPRRSCATRVQAPCRDRRKRGAALNQIVGEYSSRSRKQPISRRLHETIRESRARGRFGQLRIARQEAVRAIEPTHPLPASRVIGRKVGPSTCRIKRWNTFARWTRCGYGRRTNPRRGSMQRGLVSESDAWTASVFTNIEFVSLHNCPFAVLSYSAVGTASSRARSEKASRFTWFRSVALAPSLALIRSTASTTSSASA